MTSPTAKKLGRKLVVAAAATAALAARTSSAQTTAPQEQAQVQPAPGSAVPLRKISVQGEINKPGAYSLDSPTKVLQALVNAGGFRDNANPREIVILRQKEPLILRFTFNYEEVIAGTNPKQNIWLEPGDVIVVK